MGKRRVGKIKSMNIQEELTKIFGDRLKVNEPLGRYTTFKVGGPADFFFEARNTDEFVLAVKTARANNIPLFILGGGTNLLIGDKGIRGFVVRNLASQITIKGMKGGQIGQVRTGTVYVEADSGVPINKLVRFSIEEGLAGLEMQLGLPGSVGGAVYMNSKWTHPEGYVGDAVYQVRLVTESGEEKIVPHSYFRFAYDSSIIQQTGEIIISVVFALSASDKDTLWATANESISYRRASQPQGVLSAGCTFKNLSKAEAMTAATPDGTTSAGYLIDHAGLKGHTIGDAQISPVHANFIVNTGKATAADVVELIEVARAKVKEQFGVTLVEEIIRVGEF